MNLDAELETIDQAYRDGRLDQASQLAEDRLRDNAEDGQAWERLGLIRYAQGDADIAVSLLEYAALLYPLRPAARVCLAHGYGRVGRKELSRDLLVDLMDDNLLSEQLLLQVATGLDGIEHSELAMQACRRAVNRDPQNAQAWYDMSYYAARCGSPPSLTESLARRAIELNPEQTSWRIGLASLLMKLDRRPEAADLVRELSEQQIEEICCRCCLERVAEIYDSIRDFRRLTLCRMQLLSMELDDHDSPCG